MVTFVNPTFIIVNNGARAIRRVTSSIQKISKDSAARTKSTSWHSGVCESFVPCGLKTIARGISPKLSPLTLSTKANQKIMHCMKVVEIAKHSTYPLIVQKLLDSTIRLGKLSDKEMDNVLSPILGEEWRSYVKEYRKN